MLKLFSFKRPDNPILRRVSQPELGPTPQELLSVGIGVTLGMIVVLGLLSVVGGLSTALTILQIAAFPSAIIISFVIVVTATILTLRETEGETYELLRLTNISTLRVVWGLSVGILYRLRKYILSFMWAFALGILPIALRVREISADDMDDPTTLDVPLMPLIIIFLLVLFIGAFGITLMLITSSIMSALRFRSVGVSASTALLSGGLAIVIGVMMWLIFVSLAGGLWSMIFAIFLAPIPYLVGLIFAKRWRTNQLRLIAVTSYAPVAVIIFLLFTAILGFGRGDAESSDIILFWGLNFIFAFLLLMTIQSEWGQAACPELIVLMVWQLLLVILLALGEGIESEAPFQTVVWLVSDTLLITPFAAAIINIDRARQWVWEPIE